MSSIAGGQWLPYWMVLMENISTMAESSAGWCDSGPFCIVSTEGHNHCTGEAWEEQRCHIESGITEAQLQNCPITQLDSGFCFTTSYSHTTSHSQLDGVFPSFVSISNAGIHKVMSKLLASRTSLKAVIQDAGMGRRLDRSF